MLIDTNQLANEVRAARTAQGWTQARLAELTDLSRNTISLVERGQVSPTWTTVRAIVTTLGLEDALILTGGACTPGVRPEFTTTKGENREPERIS